MEHTLALARALASQVGRDLAAAAAFTAERAYWIQRNQAGSIQKTYQDSLGLGWANQDHHTFRSSREAFPYLIQILQALGFELRERFYARLRGRLGGTAPGATGLWAGRLRRRGPGTR